MLNNVKSFATTFGRTFQTTTKTAVATGTAFTKHAAEQAPAVGLGLAKSFGYGVGYSLVTMELIDFVGNWYSEHQRRKDLKQVTGEVSRHGINDERKRKLELLNRMPQRRTFGQFIRDLPPRTVRRFWRAVLWEAGWWTVLFTSPIWVATTALFTAWSWLVVLPIATFRGMRNKDFEDEVFLDKWMGTPGRWNKTVLRRTFHLGVSMMTRALETRIYSRTTVYCNDEGEKVLDKLQTEAYEVVSKIEDGHTAYVWGERLAELVRQESDLMLRTVAYAQSNYWIDAHILPQFKENVRSGFRDRTPVMWRDLLTEV